MYFQNAFGDLERSSIEEMNKQVKGQLIISCVVCECSEERSFIVVALKAPLMWFWHSDYLSCLDYFAPLLWL